MNGLEDKILDLINNNDFPTSLTQLFEKTERKVEFYEYLFQIIEEEPSLDVVEKVLKFLSVIKPIPYTYEVLINKLSHNSSKIRMAAAETLSVFRPDISKILIDKLKSDSITVELVEIIWLLGKIGKKEDIEFLNSLKKQIECSNQKRKMLEAVNNAIKEITLRYVDLWFEKKERKE
ncbi:MAG: HEAT repeat domain-containing protein [Candidatus Heimdallarchaeaceae archaeon]